MESVCQNERGQSQKDRFGQFAVVEDGDSAGCSRFSGARWRGGEPESGGIAKIGASSARQHGGSVFGPVWWRWRQFLHAAVHAVSANNGWIWRSWRWFCADDAPDGCFDSSICGISCHKANFSLKRPQTHRDSERHNEATASLKAQDATIAVGFWPLASKVRWQEQNPAPENDPETPIEPQTQNCVIFLLRLVPNVAF